MTEWEKAEAGLLYQAHLDPELYKGRKRSQELNYDYNQLRPCQQEERDKMIYDNFEKVGKNCIIEQPFFADFWERISVGDNFFANYNFVALAGNKIEIGNNVWIAPDCGLYAAGHPFDVQQRLEGIEYAWPIRIGNNVWIGGGVKIMGGVSIGDNTIIGAGSIVTKSIPANVLAAGNPCKVIREIKPEDDDKYKKGFPGWE